MCKVSVPERVELSYQHCRTSLSPSLSRLSLVTTALQSAFLSPFTMNLTLSIHPDKNILCVWTCVLFKGTSCQSSPSLSSCLATTRHTSQWHPGLGLNGTRVIFLQCIIVPRLSYGEEEKRETVREMAKRENLLRTIWQFLWCYIRPLSSRPSFVELFCLVVFFFQSGFGIPSLSF